MSSRRVAASTASIVLAASSLLIQKSHSEEGPWGPGVLAGLKRYGIWETFKGFGFSKSPTVDNAIQIQWVPSPSELKGFSGVTIQFTEDGKLKKIEPLFHNEGAQVAAWALDKYADGTLDVNSFWGVLHAAISEGMSDLALLKNALIFLKRKPEKFESATLKPGDAMWQVYSDSLTPEEKISELGSKTSLTLKDLDERLSKAK